MMAKNSQRNGTLLTMGTKLRATSFSLEFFPPKDEAGEQRLWLALSELAPLAPDFVSVTYGAGGSTRDRTIRVTSEITKRTQIPTVAHLTCVGSSKTELIQILNQFKNSGIESILALRGDPVGGPTAKWEPTTDGLNYAQELVEIAVQMGFKVGVGAYPDGHPASNHDLAKDITVLLAKEQAGASFATTQFFFEIDKWQGIVDKLAAANSSLPVIAGVLPITNVKQLNRMAQLSGMQIPSDIAEKFAKLADDVEGTRKLGVEIATNLGAELLRRGAPGIHFYTMNSAQSTIEIAQNLGLIKNA
jgi:methylenetetrahydrofolate reductase (NADPH)